MTLSGTAPGVEWAVAHRPFPGQSVSGDHYIVKSFSDSVLLAVIDGLGHGPEAARASQIAVDSLEHLSTAELAVAVNTCHEALRGSRGAVLTLAVYHPELASMEWTGVGNVDCVLWHLPDQPGARRDIVAPRGGVVGYDLPRLHISRVDVAPGDVCCLVSDGILTEFASRTLVYHDPVLLANHTLEQFARNTDDALVLAVRFTGNQ